MLVNEEVERNSVTYDCDSQFNLDGPDLSQTLNRNYVCHLQNQHYNAHCISKAKGDDSLEDAFLFMLELVV